ncbi:MAG: biopolymer transporter ExbD [Verrucomicrobiales bacterium]
MSKLQESLEQADEAKGDLSPMIDLVFLLLIFFMVASTMIRFRMDPDVKIPIGDAATKKTTAAGRVIINVYSDEITEQKGGRRFADEFSNPLTEDEITEMVKEADLRNKKASVDTWIHLRADKNAPVEFTKRAVKAASAAGVIEVVFSTYTN